MNNFSVQTAAPVYMQIAEHLEQRIISMELKEGDRLPSTAELAELYGVTPVTVQKSLQRLVELDLIERTPRRGTFVKSHQISNTVGIIFGYNPFKEESPVYIRLLEDFRKYADSHNINIKIYLDICGQESGRAIYDVRSDVSSGKLKALIAIDKSEVLEGWLKQQQAIPWITPVAINFYASSKLGISYLAGRGYRRIMMVSMYAPNPPYEDWKENAASEKAGMKEAIEKYENCECTFSFWGNSEIDGYQIGKKIFSSAERPDAIFIHHDILCRGLLLAIMELGLKIPNDIAVLTHANLGCDFATPVELTKVVFDPAEMVSSCFTRLDKALKDSKPGEKIQMPSLEPRLLIGKSCGE